MVSFLGIFNGDSRVGQAARNEVEPLLPTQRHEVSSSVSPEEVTKVALRLKYQIEKVIPCELEEELITKAHSPIITDNVVQTAREAGGKEHKACVVYCLLIVRGWFKKQSQNELWDQELFTARMAAAEVIAKKIIESEENVDYMMEDMLLQRFSIVVNGEEAHTSNAIERAVDSHCLTVISSSGYQKTVTYMWRGWLVPKGDQPSHFVRYDDVTNTNFWAHWDPARIRVPKYQNGLQIFFTLLFLVLYTIAINTINSEGDIDVIEAFLYLFTLGFVTDEIVKLWKAGLNYLGFWNVFNNTLYMLLATSFILRMMALSHATNSDPRVHYNVLSYNFLAFAAPFFWLRILLYLDTYRFFGAMLVVIKVMMNESIIFFALLSFLVLGFLQAFIGLDNTGDDVDSTAFVMKAMINAIMTSPDFEGFEDFSHPFGIVLYYIYTFITMVVLLNILIALYSSAYSDITEDADTEYMALFAQKAIQFVRAPDENVFIPPFNLIEFTFLIAPLSWWMPAKRYTRLNNIVMGIIYSPLLCITAFLEVRQARRVTLNRKRGEEDEDTTEEWEQLEWNPRQHDETWAEKVESTKPNVEVDGATLEVRELRAEVEVLKGLVEVLVKRGAGREGQGQVVEENGEQKVLEAAE